MDRFADERDLALLENDKYTFFVLRRILGADGTLLLTDHEKLILCHSCPPYPVWIWTADDAAPEEMERAYRLAAENRLLDGTHSFNMKYELARFFLERAGRDGLALTIRVNMFAYDCPQPVEPGVRADGAIHRCTVEDLDELTDFMLQFHQESAIDRKDREAYRSDALSAIQSGRMFFWRDAQGRSVASCRYAPDGDMASLNLVYTRPEHRRKHYAENLVYQVTRLAIDEGCMPMLYTDADYPASNACYEKIGYVLRGRLCTIG